MNIVFVISLLLEFSLFWQYPRESEEHVPLSSHHVTASALSSGLLVDTNLDTSVPDAYIPPPAPMPFDVALGHPQTPQSAQDTCGDKNDGAVQTTNSGSIQETAGVNRAKCDDMKESDCKAQPNSELDSAKELEIELSKSVEPLALATEEEDVCPICLEGNVLTISFHPMQVMDFIC